MKTIYAFTLLAAVAFATPSHAQLQAASLIGNYTVTGTETDGKKYDAAVLTGHFLGLHTVSVFAR
jgi:predicted secreted Zn-dependent protease